MEIIKVHINKRNENVCNQCYNYELCTVYGGTCKKRGFIKILIKLKKKIKDKLIK